METKTKTASGRPPGNQRRNSARQHQSDAEQPSPILIKKPSQNVTALTTPPPEDKYVTAERVGL